MGLDKVGSRGRERSREDEKCCDALVLNSYLSCVTGATLCKLKPCVWCFCSVCSGSQAQLTKKTLNVRQHLRDLTQKDPRFMMDSGRKSRLRVTPNNNALYGKDVHEATLWAGDPSPNHTYIIIYAHTSCVSCEGPLLKTSLLINF